MDTQARKKLALGRGNAAHRAPYFATMLTKLVPREMPELDSGTMAVTKDGLLLYVPDYVKAQTVEQTAADLVHECYHLMNRHHARAGAHELKLWFIACDLEINDGLVATGWDLPNCLLPKLFGLPDGKLAEEYYDLLRNKAKKQPQPGGKPGVARGECGSCAGGNGQGDGDQKDGQGEPKNDPGARSPQEMLATVKETAQAVVAHVNAKGRGSVPAGLLRLAQAALEPPKIHWRDKARVLTASAVQYVAGHTEHCWNRFSRRQAGVGFGLGRPVIPATRSPLPQVAFVIDTSGSMGQRDLEVGLREFRGVLQQLSARVTFLTCDAEAYDVKEVSTVDEALKLLKGGGGTDFRPAFDMLEKRKPRPSLVIYFTDGDGEYPRTAPAWCRTVWALVNGGYTKPPWGDVINVED